MLSATGKCALKFHIGKFEVNKNDFARNFDGKLSSVKEFVETFRALSLSSLPSTSQDNVSQATITVEECGEIPGLKTPKKKMSARKRKSENTTANPEGAELTSPEKCLKLNSIDEEIESHYLGMLPFYIDSTSFDLPYNSCGHTVHFCPR